MHKLVYLPYVIISFTKAYVACFFQCCHYIIIPGLNHVIVSIFEAYKQRFVSICRCNPQHIYQAQAIGLTAYVSVRKSLSRLSTRLCLCSLCFPWHYREEWNIKLRQHLYHEIIRDFLEVINCPFVLVVTPWRSFMIWTDCCSMCVCLHAWFLWTKKQ